MTASLKGAVSRFGQARDGTVVVEFALLSTVLIGLFAIALDFSYMVGAKRDAERSSTLIVRAMSSCPYKANPAVAAWADNRKGTDCVTDTLKMVNDRLANVLVNIPNSILQSAAVQRTNGAIVMCSGVSNYMPASVSSSVMSVLGVDNDVGMFAVIEVSYTPFLPQILVTYGVTTSPKYTKPTIDLWGNGPSFACAAKT